MDLNFFFRFLRRENDTVYVPRDHNGEIMWFVHGYPKPTISYYFNNQLLSPGGRYNFSYSRNGQATLFITR